MFTGCSTGGITWAFTVTFTVDTAVPPRPSMTVTVKLSLPVKPAFGVYVQVPSVFTVTVPFVGLLPFV